MPKPFIRHEESIKIAKLMACMATLFIQPECGCCHPPLADSAFCVQPVPGRPAPGSMEKINSSCGQGMHPSRKTLKLYYFWVEVVKSWDSSNGNI